MASEGRSRQRLDPLGETPGRVTFGTAQMGVDNLGQSFKPGHPSVGVDERDLIHDRRERAETISRLSHERAARLGDFAPKFRDAAVPLALRPGDRAVTLPVSLDQAPASARALMPGCH